MIRVGTGTRLYRIWKGMVGRCHTRSDTNWAIYGGRGISVDQNWRTFVGFLDWALAGYRHGLSLDRINSDGDYTPANCRWIPSDLNAARQQMERSGGYLASLAGKLTDEIIQSQRSADMPRKLSDGGGLHLRISSTGHRSWRYAYRFGGKGKLLTIGSYPAMSIGEARERHAIARAQLMRGRDPASIKQETLARRKRYHAAKKRVS